MSAVRLRNVTDTDMMERARDDYITQGYTVKSEGEKTMLMKKQTWGSAAGWVAAIVIAIFLLIAARLGPIWIR